jgi:hypothetical protein
MGNSGTSNESTNASLRSDPERDRDPDVTRVDGEETDFVLIPDPPELLDEDKFAERLMQLVNVAGDDWSGDRVDGYENPDLFCQTDID